jgi:hypothetical protein
MRGPADAQKEALTMTMCREITDEMVERAARIISPNCMWDAEINRHLERRKDNARAKARKALEAALSAHGEPVQKTEG